MSINALIDKYCIKKDRTLKKICAPLNEKLGIHTFSYFWIDCEGRFGILANYPELCEFYFGEKMYLNNPYLIHPSLLQSGYTQTLTAPEDVNNSNRIFEKFQTFNILLKLKCVGDNVEGFVFSLKGAAAKDPVEFYSKLEMLNAFIPYFKQEAKPIIEAAKEEDCNLRIAKGNSFFVPDTTLPLSNPKMREFLKEISPLSKRERECLELFKQGRSAQATAAILGLSRRTVEHYIDNVKEKLGCYSKWDLLDY